MTRGERIWGWVEMALNIPYFLATVLLTEESDLTMERNLVLSDVRAIVELADASDEDCQLVRVGLLSPGYMNGTGAYQLNQLEEIWQEPDSGGHRFVLANGASMEMFLSAEPVDDERFERIFSMSPSTQPC
ncbi:MAG: hypothetical protein ACYCUY_00385 [Acidithiobacillus sp.]|uniref:hypothetical protein n=1 Tax=Acidithiobacillus ferrooxidans TaxID=920 RepID=UPI001C06996F|nr:hypothetical protein [Acidithiobacillus ferrooxidans]